MKFSVRKLPKEATTSMRRVPIRLFEPFTLMMAPVYTLLEKNEKLVAVKAPLSYFAPSELAKFKGALDFFLPKFIDKILPFQQGGEKIKSLLTLQESQKIKTSEGPKEAKVPISAFQLSDAVLTALGPLWGSKAQIEPFFLVFLVSELCPPISEAQMTEASEKSVDRFELAVLRAHLAVFFALHLGFFDCTTLTRIRDRVFAETVGEYESNQRSTNVDQLVALVYRLLSDSNVTTVKISDLSGQNDVERKLSARFDRVRRLMLTPNTPDMSLFGEGGICGDP